MPVGERREPAAERPAARERRPGGARSRRARRRRADARARGRRGRGRRPPARAAGRRASPGRCRSRSRRRPRRSRGPWRAPGFWKPSSITIACAPAGRGGAAGGGAVAADPGRREGGEEQRLVADLGGACAGARRPRTGPCEAAAVAARDDVRGDAAGGEPLDERDHRRGLAGAAGGQVADADHRHADARRPAARQPPAGGRRSRAQASGASSRASEARAGPAGCPRRRGRAHQRLRSRSAPIAVEHRVGHLGALAAGGPGGGGHRRRRGRAPWSRPAPRRARPRCGRARRRRRRRAGGSRR